jgi:predicted lipoprotein with Yx(FWY)xxD motif
METMIGWRRFRRIPYTTAVVVALALVAVSLVAAACGDDDNSAAETPASSQTTGAVPTAGDASVVTTADLPGLGEVLTTANGMTLYTFTADTPGVSTCTGSCAQAWPPLTTAAASVAAPAGATGAFSLVARDDGSKQVAYNGAPLYTYASDTKPGDATGQGVGGKWFVALAAGSPGGSPTVGGDSTGASGYNY